MRGQRQEGLQDSIAIDSATGQPVMCQRSPERCGTVAVQHGGKGRLRIGFSVDQHGHRPQEVQFRIRRRLADQPGGLPRLGAEAEMEQAPDRVSDRLGVRRVEFAVEPGPCFGEKLRRRHLPAPGG